MIVVDMLYRLYLGILCFILLEDFINLVFIEVGVRVDEVVGVLVKWKRMKI